MVNKALVVLILLFLSSCSFEEELPDVDYPRVRTSQSVEVMKDGVLLKGQIISIGDTMQIDEYGFIWSESIGAKIAFSDKVVLGSTNTIRSFEGKIDRGLKNNTTYYAKAYAKIDDFWVYGQEIEFKSIGSNSPIIHDFRPKVGVIGDTVSIIGKYLSYNPYNLKISFGEFESAIVSASDTLIKVAVPKGVSPTRLTVSVANNIKVTTEDFNFIQPEFDSISHTAAYPGDTLVLYGKNLNPGLEEVLFGNITLRIVEGQLDKSVVKVVMPRTTYSLSNRINIKTRGTTISSKELFKINQLEISNLSPMNPNYLEEVIIRGKEFPEGRKIRLILNGEEVPISHSNSNEIRFNFPNYDNNLFQVRGRRITLELSINNFIYQVAEQTIGNEWYRIGYPNYIANKKIYGFAYSPSSSSNFLIQYQDALDGSFNINPVGLHGTFNWLNPIKVYTDFNYIESVSTFSTIEGFYYGMLIKGNEVSNGFRKLSKYLEPSGEFIPFPGEFRTASFFTPNPVRSEESILMGGGVDPRSNKEFNDLWSFNQYTNTWTQLPDLPEAGVFSFVQVYGSLYILNTTSRTVYEINLKSTEIVNSWTLSSEYLPKLYNYGNKLYVSKGSFALIELDGNTGNRVNSDIDILNINKEFGNGFIASGTVNYLYMLFDDGVYQLNPNLRRYWLN